MLNKFLELFTDRVEVEEEFDTTYFKELCIKKRELEVLLDHCIDVNLHDVLAADLIAVDKRINLIVINEKKRQGLNYHTMTPKHETKESKERVAPIFVNGEMI